MTKARVFGRVRKLSDRTKLAALFVTLWIGIGCYLSIGLRHARRGILEGAVCAGLGTVVLWVTVGSIGEYIAETKRPLTPEAQQYLAYLARKKKDERRKAIAEALSVLTGLGVLGILIYGGWSWIAKPTIHSAVAQYDTYTCKENLQGDLDEAWGPTEDPSVTKCSGDSRKATCLVRSLESGIYKTRPVVVDCSERHIETGLRGKAEISANDKRRWETQLRRFANSIKLVE
jgi:hypothetical protein